MKNTAIIVPCYNESKRLKASVFGSFAINHPEICFIFVNDGSTDTTRSIINILCQNLPHQIFCVDLKRNYGKAEAVRQGFLMAMEMNFTIIGYWDADLSTPLEAILKFHEIIVSTGKTVVIGARVKLLGRKIERLLIRHYAGRLFATIVSMMLQIPIYDTQCGAKLFKNDASLNRIFIAPFSVNWTFDVEIIARLKRLCESTKQKRIDDLIVEYPLETWTHVPGSKIKYTDIFIVFKELLTIIIFLYWPQNSKSAFF